MKLRGHVKLLYANSITIVNSVSGLQKIFFHKVPIQCVLIESEMLSNYANNFNIKGKVLISVTRIVQRPVRLSLLDDIKHILALLVRSSLIVV